MADIVQSHSTNPPRAGLRSQIQYHVTHACRKSLHESNANMSQLKTFSVPANGISEAIIDADVKFHLGREASLVQTVNRNGQGVYIIKATSAPTTNMLADMKVDSQKWRQDKTRNPRLAYTQSSAYGDRRRGGPSSTEKYRRSISNMGTQGGPAQMEGVSGNQAGSPIPRHTSRNETSVSGRRRSDIDSAYGSMPSSYDTAPVSKGQLPKSSNVRSQEKGPSASPEDSDDSFDDMYGFKRHDAGRR